MIQDIYPNQFYNQFKNQTYTQKDLLALVCENEILLIEDNDENLQFPCGMFFKDEPQFLFKLNEQAIFLIEILENEKDDFTKQNPKGRWFKRQELRNFKKKEIAFSAANALQLAAWYRNNQYCGKCGCKTEKSTKERMLYCKSCGLQVFPKISPAVIIGIYNKENLLLTKYRNGPTTNFALVAGFCEIGETLEETVHREVFEEVGLKVKNLRYYKSQPWPFSETLLAGFFCEVEGNARITLEEEELALAQWTNRKEIPESENKESLTREMIDFFKNNPNYF